MNSYTVAATRLVWTAVILNSSETSGPLSNGRILCLEVYIKSFEGQKGGSLEPPLPTGLQNQCKKLKMEKIISAKTTEGW